MKYISVVNFDEHQHYRDRNVIWIKLYTKLLTSTTIYQLTPEERWCYIALLLLAPTKNNKILQLSSFLRQFFGISREKKIDKILKKMVHLKLITIKSDSKALSKRYQDATDRREEEKERKKDIYTTITNLKNKLSKPL